MLSATDHKPTPSASGSSSTASAEAGLVRVFLPPTSASSSSTANASSARASGDGEEELKPTPEELKAAFLSTSSPLLRRGPDAPLLTRALREKEEQRLGLHSSRNRVWNNVRIRIRFSDRTMIESTFKETDTIDSVYDFLHESVDETARNVGVVIYTAPPKVEYKREDKKVKGKTLRELGLIPSAVVSLRWDDARMNSNAFPAPLKGELKSQAQPLPPPPSFDQPQEQQATATASSSSNSSNASKEAKPVPKWLKNIVKK